MKSGVIAAYELDRSALRQHGNAAFNLLVAVSASRLGSLSLCCRAAVWVPHPSSPMGACQSRSAPRPEAAVVPAEEDLDEKASFAEPHDGATS